MYHNRIVMLTISPDGSIFAADVTLLAKRRKHIKLPITGYITTEPLPTNVAEYRRNYFNMFLEDVRHLSQTSWPRTRTPILKIKNKKSSLTMINQIHDIYSEPNFIKTIVPFSELRSTMNHLLRNRDYHSQCTLGIRFAHLEFYLILETLDLSKDSFTTRPLIKAMFNCKLTSLILGFH